VKVFAVQADGSLALHPDYKSETKKSFDEVATPPTPTPSQ
jgi:hypothetical protein